MKTKYKNEPSQEERILELLRELGEQRAWSFHFSWRTQKRGETYIIGTISGQR